MVVLEFDGKKVYTNDSLEVRLSSLKRAREGMGVICEWGFARDDSLGRKIPSFYDEQAILSGTYVVVNIEGESKVRSVIIKGLKNIDSFMIEGGAKEPLAHSIVGTPVLMYSRRTAEDHLIGFAFK